MFYNYKFHHNRLIRHCLNLYFGEIKHIGLSAVGSLLLNRQKTYSRAVLLTDYRDCYRFDKNQNQLPGEQKLLKQKEKIWSFCEDAWIAMLGIL
jgi:hypothetical protein